MVQRAVMTKKVEVSSRMYLFGTKANNYYIVDKDNNEAYVFDGFGRATGKVTAGYVFSIASRLIPVDTISFLGNPLSEESSVFYDGTCAILNYNHLEAYQKVRGKLKLQSPIIFRIRRDQEEPGLSQIVLLLVEGSTSKDDVSRLLNISRWPSK